MISAFFALMSSINPHFTFNYVQPESYRFSHDSVFMARRVYEEIVRSHFDVNLNYRILDLCSGSGIVGLDLIYHLVQDLKFKNSKFEVDFLEVQHIYESYFKENRLRLNKILKTNFEFSFLNMNYDLVCYDKNLKEKYDILVCNPPYFFPQQGKLSDNEFKNRCRFFIDSTDKKLLQSIAYLLKPRAKAYVLFQDLKVHGLDWKILFQQFQKELKIEKLTTIRKTDLYVMTKCSEVDPC